MPGEAYTIDASTLVSEDKDRDNRMYSPRGSSNEYATGAEKVAKCFVFPRLFPPLSGSYPQWGISQGPI